MDVQFGNVGNMIQVAIAPAFLLVGVATHFRVLANRLARISDRSRVLIQQAGDEPDGPECQAALDILSRRMHLIQRAIALSALCALLICVVIAALFVDAVFVLGLDTFIAGFFVMCMLALIASFVYFLREIFIATETLSVSMRSRPGAG